MLWNSLPACVVTGHRVASGGNGDPRFPGGTIRMQWPHFASLGLELSHLYPGTLNVSIAPSHYTVRSPLHTFADVKWHPTEPAETFSFFDCRVTTASGATASGYIYHPHPETKPEHFQKPDVLELLLPRLDGVEYGATIILEVDPDQIEITPA
jgi:hypothetical protein